MNGQRIARLFLLLAVLAAFSAAAAVPDMPELKRMLDSATTEKYPDADTVTIYDGEVVTYQKDGLSESTQEFCVKALTEAGRKGLRRMSFSFNSDYGSLAVASAAVIKPDGTKKELDLEKLVSVAINSGQMRSNIFTPSRKELSLMFPELDTGDAVLVTLRRSFLKTPFPGIFSETFLLQDDSPVLLAEVTIDEPKALPLRSTAIKNGVAGTVRSHPAEERGERRIRRWTARNVPQLIPEPDMPELVGEVQRLLVSTAGKWQDISKWYYDLCRPRLDAVDDELKAAVKKLVEGKKTDEEKAMALFQFVSQKVRYTGVNNENEAPGFEPHDVKDTFRKRHGVCRDKAALLTAMLELAGLKAYPALFYAGKPPVDAEVPASRFNHAVVAWETSPRKYQLMDPTFETTAEFLPAYMANQSFLVARPDGETLMRSPSPPAERNLLRIRTEARYLANGSLEGTSTLEFTGVNDQMYRAAFSRRSPNAMRQIFSRQLKMAVPGAELTSFEVSPADARDTATPLKVVLGYTSDRLLPLTHSAEALPLPELARHFGIVPYMLSSATLDKRKHTLLFDTTAMTEESFKLRLPESVRILGMPNDAEAGDDKAGFAWKRELKSNDHVLEGRSRTAVTQLEIAPERYADFKSLLRKYAALRSAAPMASQDLSSTDPKKLAALFPDADSFLEYDNTSVELNPDGSIETVRDSRRRILNYAGVKRHSEIKIRYNPKWEKVEIQGVVTSPDGKRHYLGPKDIIEMDAPDVSAAPRYPGDKIKVAVLPGVAVGSLVDTVVTMTEAGEPFFHKQLPFNDRTPTAVRDIVMRLPKERFRVSATPVGVKYTSRAVGAKIRHNWKSADLPTLPDELRQAPRELFAPTLFVSNGKFEGYAKKLNERLRRLAETEAKTLDRAAAALKADSAKRAAINIRDFAYKRIRAAGPALNAMPVEYLTGPERTLADGYGSSADRATVIAALLRRAGIKYRFVAASDLPFVAEYERQLKNYPAPVFTEVLVYIPELDVYLNDTGRYAALGSTAHADRIGLDLDSGRLLSIRPQYNLDDEVRTTFRIRLHAGGSADVAVTRYLYGGAFERENRLLSELTPQEREQHFEMLAAQLSQAAKLSAPGSFDFSVYPGRIDFGCRIENFAVASGEYLQFDLPGFQALAGAAASAESHRLTPVLRDRAERASLKYSIDFPDGHQVLRRQMADVELGRRNSGYFVEHTTVNRDRIVIDAKLALPVELIQPQDYVELVNLQKDLSSLSAKRIILKAKTGRETGK